MDEGKAEQIKHRHTTELMKLQGVNGVGLKEDEKGDFVLVLYLDDLADLSRLPKAVDGLEFVYEHTGKLRGFLTDKAAHDDARRV